VALAVLFGSGAFLCLLLIGGEHLLAMLTALAILAFLFGAHYMIWGRTWERDREAPGPRAAGRSSPSPPVNGGSLDESRPHK
jgi:hypothetical protein